MLFQDAKCRDSFPFQFSRAILVCSRAENSCSLHLAVQLQLRKPSVGERKRCAKERSSWASIETSRNTKLCSICESPAADELEVGPHAADDDSRRSNNVVRDCGGRLQIHPHLPVSPSITKTPPCRWRYRCSRILPYERPRHALAAAQIRRLREVCFPCSPAVKQAGVTRGGAERGGRGPGDPGGECAAGSLRQDSQRARGWSQHPVLSHSSPQVDPTS
jgi:hypothetical protein